MAGAKNIWMKVQARLGLTPDGIPGPLTAAAVERAIWGTPASAAETSPAPAAPPAAAHPAAGETFSDRTERVLASLLPQVQPAFRALMAAAREVAAKHGLTVEAISGLRTYAAQDDLYAQGRTRPGRIVTKAKAGYSNHNFGIALDMALFRGRSYVDADEPALAGRVYAEIAKWAGELGIAWGGDWKGFKDTPHYEYKTGLTMAQMRARVAAGQSVV